MRLLAFYVLSVTSALCQWKMGERADPQASVSLFFALPYSNREKSSELLQAVSDPSSPQYRLFPPVETVTKLIAPQDTVRQTVQTFLSKRLPLLSGRWSGFGHNFHLDLSVEQVEAMLHTECYVYRYECDKGMNDRNITTIRTINQTFPEFELSRHLAYIGGVTQFPILPLGAKAFVASSDPPPGFIHFTKVNRTKSLTKNNNNNNNNDRQNNNIRSFHHVNSLPSTTTQLLSSPKADITRPMNNNKAFANLGDIFSGTIFGQEEKRIMNSQTNPFLRIYGDDGKVSMQVQIICPDGTPSELDGTCNGVNFESMRVRYKGGSNSQTSQSVSPAVCGQYAGDEVCSCQFGLLLAVNYVRYAFGVDIKFANSQMYSYDLTQRYIVGEQAKSPRFFRRFYDIPDTLVTKNPSLYHAVASLTLADGSTGFFSPKDLTLFHNTFNVHPPVGVDMQGATNDPTRVDIETQLDIQWITAIGEGARASVWHASGFQSFESIIEQIQSAAAAGQPFPQVLSISYGAPESQQGSALANLEEGFKSLGLLGVTVLVASGDSGAFWNDCTRFEPSYPGSSQYVTSVGATQLISQFDSQGTCRVRETACSVALGAAITTGGGFSKVIPQPDWQREAVAVYMNSSSHPTLPFDSTKRGYPDISVFGHNYNIVQNAQMQAVDGTSASSPAVAGIITLINDVLLTTNQSLGFLNPLLYQIFKNHPDAFADITMGSNGCLRDQCCEAMGFTAAAGWDAVSGIGSPIFSRFAKWAGANYPGTSAPPVFTEADCTVPVVGPYSFWTPWVIAAVVAGALIVLCILIGCISMACKRPRKREYSLQNPLLHDATDSEQWRPLTPTKPGSHPPVFS